MKRYFGLQGCSAAWKVNQLAREQGQLLVVCDDANSLERLSAELDFFAADLQVLTLLGWESLPYEHLSPPIDISASRVRCLFKVFEEDWDILLTSAESVSQKIIPYNILKPLAFEIKEASEFPRQDLIDKLNFGGFRRVSIVEEVGDYAVRGSVVDFFPSSHESPVRVEFFDDEIERIRLFDPNTQRSIGSIEQIRVLPVSEYIDLKAPCFDDDLLKQGIVSLKSLAVSREVPPRESAKILDAFKTGRRLPGLETIQVELLPAFESLINVIPDNVSVLLNNKVSVLRALDARWELVADRETKAIENHELAPDKQKIFVSPDELNKEIKNKRQIYFESLQLFEPDSEIPTEKINSYTVKDLGVKIRSKAGSGKAFEPLSQALHDWRDKNYSVIFTVGSDGRASRLQKILLGLEWDVPLIEQSFTDVSKSLKRTPISILKGQLAEGVVLPDQDLVIIAEPEVFAERSTRHSPGAAAVKKLMTSLAQLAEDDFVVHQDYGIGIYRGLKHIEVEESISDFIHIEYADSQLYLPVQHIGKVQKFSAPEGREPTLDKLSSTKWQTRKRKVKEAVVALAGDLIKLYAVRNESKGYSYSPLNIDDEEFSDSFPYTETSDQAVAIEDVLKDMAEEKPMDRLVCGDVGFGKTEVAMRAAYKAVQDSKQVAVLSPTTILAEQHRQSFEKRFAGFPVKVGGLSRFYKTADNKETLEKVAAGDVDIVIGTHKLLQKDVHFKDLGLLVVDEEHRFGVKQKEKLKQLKKDVDVLTLTATPIPRTLHMSLLDVRDVSIISTPPHDRRAIRTYVALKEEGLIRDAILREIQRGGQCFYLHNRVQSIDLITAGLSELVPEAKFAYAHGQMKETQLEKIMKAFLDGEVDVLVSTTIIESGIDIPNANTLIVDQAHMFGLAQLYQIRGRVGRSSRQAYAYLMIPPARKLGKEAEERLKALQALDDLGQGFNLAMRDLEIRGAGNLLGKEQSGNVISVGFEMYTKILKEAAAQLKGEEVSLEEVIDPEVKLGIDAFIPEFYIPDIPERLVLYQRLASLKSHQETEELIEEMVDRFGPMSKETANLVEVMRIRALARRFGVLKIELSKQKLRLEFSPQTSVQPNNAIKLATEQPDRYRLGKSNTFTLLDIPEEIEEVYGVYQRLESLLEELSA